MNTAVLFSGGKDSGLALYHALQHTDVKCLIIMKSSNTESYMFHTPNITWAEKQAGCIGISYIIQETKGEKESELKDLEKAISKAKKQYKIEGIVTGAIASVYQASRIQIIADKLGIECFNPLWQKDQNELLKELVDTGFEVVIVGVFGEGLETFLGRVIDKKFLVDIKKVQEKYKINPAGEGGEYESFVLNAPYYKRKLKIERLHTIKDDAGGRVLVIESLQ